jgi:hypothetical protein
LPSKSGAGTARGRLISTLHARRDLDGSCEQRWSGRYSAHADFPLEYALAGLLVSKTVAVGVSSLHVVPFIVLFTVFQLSPPLDVARKLCY